MTLEQKLQEALIVGRESMYLTNPWFYHWVNRRAKLLAEQLIPEVQEADIDAQERQDEANEQYKKLVYGDEL